VLVNCEAMTTKKLQRLGAELLHQQLYVIGRDIASKHGNLLLDYGCHRNPSPIPGIPSLYTSSWNRRSRLSLRGFGVFVGNDSIGGIFVQRYTFEPRWMPSSHFVPIAWLPGEMPRTRRSRRSWEQRQANSMLLSMIQWFIEYEAWVAEQFGCHYRIGQLAHFPTEKYESIHWNLHEDWNALQDTIRDEK
jgi:hypothetical protein